MPKKRIHIDPPEMGFDRAEGNHDLSYKISLLTPMAVGVKVVVT